MKVEILAVGTEILLGDILNTNAQFLAKELSYLGFEVYNQSVVGDNCGRLKKALSDAFERADMVITTGGLGPTKDDLTKETAGEFFNKKMVLHEPSMKRLEETFARMNREVSYSNKKQAYFPEDSIVIPNDNGTAPGCIINENNKIIVILPGPPREMIPMFNDTVKPYLSQFQDSILVSRVLKICGIGEGHMAEKISDIIDEQSNPTVAPYAGNGEVTLRITAKAKTEDEAIALINPVVDRIKDRLGDDVYGMETDSLEGVIANTLIKNNVTISVAESCTGGMVSSKLINYPGISSVFMEGAVTYSNEAKVNRLNVTKETLDKHGAVSSETAMEMAKGIALTSNTNIGLSTTGIAGPDGGSAEKPVGLVYIGLYINGTVKVKELKLSGDRERIRLRATINALDFLRRELNNYYK